MQSNVATLNGDTRLSDPVAVLELAKQAGFVDVLVLGYTLDEDGIEVLTSRASAGVSNKDALFLLRAAEHNIFSDGESNG